MPLMNSSFESLNPWCIDASSIKFKYTFLHAWWAVNFYNNISVFVRIQISFSGQNCFEDIHNKFKETEPVEILWLPHLWINCLLCMQGSRDEPKIYNYQQIQLSNNNFIDGILRFAVCAWPALTVICWFLWIVCCLFLSYSKKSFPVILNSLVEDKPRCENYINMFLNIFYLAWYFAHLIWILVNWSLRPYP